MRRLIINADDLGLAPEVDAAIETAHREGVLTAASLMMGEPHLAGGVEVARRNPRLAVGLHVTLTDGHPVLPPEAIPRLVQPNGRFRDDMAALGTAIAFDPAARAQMRAEVAAQFAAFAATGLHCDHVNSHKHYHLHPAIAGAIFAEAERRGIRCTRLPIEPASLVLAADAASKPVPQAILGAWCGVLRRRAARRGMRAADRVLGFAWSGAFTADRLAATVPLLPEGATEIYLHPATAAGFPGSAPGYRYAEELAALLDSRVRQAVDAAGFQRGGYEAMLYP